MSQDFTADWYALANNANTAFQNAEKNDNALRSSHAGSSAPANAEAGLQWMNQASSHEGLRVRNSGNSAWLKILEGDASFKIPVYRNDTCEGWDIDATVTDVVIALKGGSNAYNVNGGNLAGNFTYSGFDADNESAHTHGPGTLTVVLSTSGTDSNVSATNPIINQSGYLKAKSDSGPSSAFGLVLITGTVNGGTSGAGSAHGHTVSNDGTDRPRAAVCTLQYPDLT